jgi:hypothetical protein
MIARRLLAITAVLALGTGQALARSEYNSKNAAPTPPATISADTIYRAFFHAKSYQITINVTGVNSSEHVVYTVVGKGRAAPFYMTEKGNGADVAVLFTGTKACVRTHGIWNCGRRGSAVYNEVQKALPGTVLTSVPVGPLPFSTTRKVRGINCAGYTYSNDSSTGTLWVDVSTGRLIEEDATSTDGTSVVGYTSHWNDPNLRLPAAPV